MWAVTSQWSYNFDLELLKHRHSYITFSLSRKSKYMPVSAILDSSVFFFLFLCFFIYVVGLDFGFSLSLLSIWIWTCPQWRHVQLKTEGMLTGGHKAWPLTWGRPRRTGYLHQTKVMKQAQMLASKIFQSPQIDSCIHNEDAKEMLMNDGGGDDTL